MASMIRSPNSATASLRHLATFRSSVPSPSKSLHSASLNKPSLSPISLKSSTPPPLDSSCFNSSSFSTSATLNYQSTRSDSGDSNNKAQQLCVYEMNERDRNSPVYLSLSNKPTHSLGDLVPFSNKLYTGCLTKRLGITSGLCILIKNIPNKGDRYEAIYSFYLGDYGSISVQGEYLTYQDTQLAVTGGTGIFDGVYGTVKLKQIVFPFKLFYVFELKGLKSDLPEELVKPFVSPSAEVVPSPAAKALEADAVVANFTD